MEKAKRRFILSVFVQDIFAIPLAKILIKLKISANAVTFFGLFCALSSGFFYYHKQYPLGAILLFIALVLDSTDGRVARATNTFSKFGALLDSAADKVRSFIVAFMLLASFDLASYQVISLFCFYIFLPLVRMSMAKYQDDFYDPTILFWDASPLRGWFIRNGVIGLYTGWERVVVALIIAPLTPYFVPVFVSAIIVEQLIFVLGYIFCQRFRIGIDL